MEREFRRALELNPNAAWTYKYYADFLMRLKRFDESLVVARRGHELDPLTAPVNDVLSRALFYLGRCSQAVEQMRKTLELNPNYAEPAFSSLRSRLAVAEVVPAERGA